MMNDFEMRERISAQIDGESANPDDAAALIQADAEMAAYYLQYQEISRLLHDLPAPEPSPNFVEKTLVRISASRSSYNRRRYFSLAAAAVFVLAFALFLYRLAPVSPGKSAGIPPKSTAQEEPSLMHLDVPEEQLQVLLPEIIASSDVEDAMTFLEYVPADRLILALAELTVDDYYRQHAAAGDTVTQDDLIYDWTWSKTDSFNDVFELLETANPAELDALNQFWRDILAEA